MEFLLLPLSRSAGPNDKLDTDRALRPAMAAAVAAPLADAVPWTPGKSAFLGLCGGEAA